MATEMFGQIAMVLPETSSRSWNRETDDELVCIDVHPETHDVKTFTFASPAGKTFEFAAGQYFMFEIEIDGQTELRCYSISSSPKRTNAFSVTVKRVTGGTVSHWLHDNLARGARMKATGPLGHFVRPAEPERKLLLISGGSGITPVMSMVREMADTAAAVDVAFVHAGRTPLDFIFRDELRLLAGRLKGLRLHFLPETVAGEPGWAGLNGRVSPEYLQLAVPDLGERTVLCCGPAPFMHSVRASTLALGVPPSNYLEESFDAAVIDEVDGPVADAAQASFSVQFTKQARTIDVPAGQTVLSAAKKAGLKMASSCANGLCGTCKSKLLSGVVDMKHNGGIRQREIDAGLFLPCCSKPITDLVIER